MNHEDVLFARYYFAAHDAWTAGRTASVPPAWRVAFDAARDRAVSANGNLLLGINAHVQRDLPFVLYSVGLVKPDGTSRKPDHDRVNQILNRVTDDVIAEVARRFDPTIDDANLPTTLDDLVLFQSIARAGGDRVAARRALRAGPDAGSARRRRSRDRGLRRIAGARSGWPRNTCHHGRARGARRLLRDPLGKLGSRAPQHVAGHRPAAVFVRADVRSTAATTPGHVVGGGVAGVRPADHPPRPRRRAASPIEVREADLIGAGAPVAA